MTFSMETVRIVKSPTKKEPIMMLGSTSRLPCHIIIFIISLALYHQDWEQPNSRICLPEISN